MIASCTKNPSLRCNHTRAAADAVCHKLSIREQELSDVLSKMIRDRAREILKIPASPRVRGNGQETPDGGERYVETVRRLYEQLADGAISDEIYRERKAALDADAARQKQIHALKAASIARGKSAEKELDEARRIAALAVKAKKLTRELVDALIERALFYPGGQIEVEWKMSAFADVRQEEKEVMECLVTG
jgi:hypothetical protein